MKIYVKEAQIKTAAIEIKVIKIGGKQMTLAVFRQLEGLDALLDDDIVWGHVNYHGKDCPEFDHYHLVVQRGDEIYSYIYVTPESNWFASENEIEWDEVSEKDKILLQLSLMVFRVYPYALCKIGGCDVSVQTGIVFSHLNVFQRLPGYKREEIVKTIESLVDRNFLVWGIDNKLLFAHMSTEELREHLRYDEELKGKVKLKTNEMLDRIMEERLSKYKQEYREIFDKWERVRQCQQLFISV